MAYWRTLHLCPCPVIPDDAQRRSGIQSNANTRRSPNVALFGTTGTHIDKNGGSSFPVNEIHLYLAADHRFINF